MLTGLAGDILWSERGEPGELKAPTLSEGQVNEPAETPEGQFVEGLSFADKLAHSNETSSEKIAPLGTAAKTGKKVKQDEPFIKYPEELDDSGEYVLPEKTPAEVFGEAETARVLAEMEGGPNANADVELDGDHLPWDHRIHASSKAKLSKAPKGWKRKRGVSPDVIAEVEAELRAAMSAGPHNPVKTAPAPINPSLLAGFAAQLRDEEETADAEPYAPELPATPAPAAPTDSTVATFPELMAAITAGGITPAAVLAAVNLQGLTSLPLLASRADLIPAVAKTLGL